MTIIKKRGRIVRNIFVIDRYDDAPLRVPTGCWEEMLSRMYSVDPNAYRRTVCWISSDHFQIQKSRSQSGKLSCSYRAKCFKALCFLPSNPILKESFTNYNAHKAQTFSAETNVGYEDTIN